MEGTDVYARIRATLNAIKLTKVYMEQFELRRVTDVTVNVHLKFPTNEYMKKPLEQVIYNKDQLDKFLEVYQNLDANSVSLDVSMYSDEDTDMNGKAEYVDDDDEDCRPAPATPAAHETEPSEPEKLEPVHIIEVKKYIGGTQVNMTTAMLSASKLVFHSKALQSILSKVGSRPVALLTIAGPSRQGKSFMLNYMLRYLTSISEEPLGSGSDWMGKTSTFKKNQPLTDGFKWRSGMESETLGIWMWPQPFTLTTTDGSQVDVLLMDTEGVFDSNTDKDDWETIVGLSVLTSSCFIYNSINNLVEDSLSTLKPFLDFGLLSNSNPQGDTIENKPFQKLSFLIRDWSFSDDYAFGSTGGADYLKKNLDRKGKREAQLLRRQIKEGFESLECTLMPDPGQIVKKRDYNGAVAGMATEFAENVETFIEDLFDPATITAKIISGNVVTGDDLYLYFEKYVQIFNKWEIPSTQEMVDATVEVCNQAVLNKAFALYNKEMEATERKIRTNFLLDNVLQRNYDDAFHRAVEVFKKSNKMGSAEDISTLKSELQSRMKTAFEGTVLKNLNKRKELVDTAFKKLESFFTRTLEEKTSTVNGPDDFVEDVKFKKIYSDCYFLAEDMLLQELEVGSLDLLPKEAQNRVKESFASLKKTAVLKNGVRQAEARGQMHSLVADLTQRYIRDLRDEIGKFDYLPLEEFLKIDATLRYQCLKRLSKEFTGSALFDEGKKSLIENILREFEKVREFVDRQNRNYAKGLDGVVDDLVKAYSDKIVEGTIDESLNLVQVQTEEDCINLLKQHKDFNRLPREKAEQFLDALKQGMRN